MIEDLIKAATQATRRIDDMSQCLTKVQREIEGIVIAHRRIEHVQGTLLKELSERIELLHSGTADN